MEQQCRLSTCVQVMAHSHCTGAGAGVGTGPGTMGYYMLCRTVHTAPGPGTGPDPFPSMCQSLSRSLAV